MKKRSSLLGAILSICILISVWNCEAQAASGSLGISSVSGSVGSTVTVTGTVNASEAISAITVTLTYDPAGLQFVSGSQDVSGGAGRIKYFCDVMGQNKSSLSFTMKFKILKEGSFSVSGIADGYTDTDMQLISIPDGYGTVTGKAQTSNNNSDGTTGNNTSGNTGTTNNNQQDNRDSNSKLSNLQVNPGTLSPAFDANTTSYTVTVPEDTTEVTIAAAAQSSKATVSVSGGKDLKLGSNEAKVVVTAENDSTTVYNIIIMCGEKETVQIDGVYNTINENFTDDQIPTGFVKDKVIYNGREYVALKHEKGDLVLVSLQNDAGTAFYIYNQETQEFYNYVQIQISESKYIIPLPLDDTKEFEDYELIVLSLQEKSFDAWKIDDDYSVIRVMNSDGEIALYQYDSVDGTLQRYAGLVAKETVEEVEDTEMSFMALLQKYYFYIIAGLAAFSLILMISMIYFIATRKHRHQARKRKAQKKLEKQMKKEAIAESGRF